MIEKFSMIDFNYFDVTIGAIVFILGIKGFMQGFIKEIFGLLGLVSGVYFASRLSDKAGAFIDTNFFHLENSSLLRLIGFLGILITIWLIGTILGSIFSKLTSASGLGFLNRFLGFVAGGGKYFLIFALIVTALSNIKIAQEHLGKYVGNSILYPYLKATGSYLINLDPSKLHLTVKPKDMEEKNSTEQNNTVKN